MNAEVKLRGFIRQTWDVDCWEWFHEDGRRCSTPHNLCGLPHPRKRLVWREHIENIIVNTGLDKLLDATLVTGDASPAYYAGLKDTGTPVAADTMASHASWATISPYSDGTDPAITFAAVSGQSTDNSASKATFNINATDTVFGAFAKDNNTVDGATGLLFGVADFTASRAVLSGDTLNVTITCTMAAV